MRRATFLAVLVALIAGATPSSAQDASVLGVRAARRDTIAAATTVTAAFTVSNSTGDIVHVRPQLSTPADWPVLMGSTPFALAPNASTIVMVSLVVPARAAAGMYVLGLTVGTRASDSVIVRVPQRRAVDITVLDRPGYVVSGQPYVARFLLRNRGNTVARLRLRARSSFGRATVPDTALLIDADGTGVVEVSVVTPRGMSAATDDVLELTATPDGTPDGTPDVHVASARVTVVPEPNRSIEEFLRVPTQVNLRAASSDAVSPFEIFGRGPIRDGGHADIDFLFRGPTGPFSAFGERDEYRVSLVAPSWRVRLGDHLYMLSPLTGGAQPGFGGSVDSRFGPFRAGFHGQDFRRATVHGREVAGFIGVGTSAGVQGALQLVDRVGGVLPGQIGSATASFTGAAGTAETEVARSRSQSGVGQGHSIRLSRAASTYSIDVGHESADTGFSGAQRGARHSHVSASGRWFEHVSFALSGGSHRADLTRSTGVPYIDAMDLGSLAATVLGRYTIEVGSAVRTTAIAGARHRGEQQGLRVRGDQELSSTHVALEAETGRAAGDLATGRGYNSVSLSARRPVGSGHLSGWMERYSGGAITRGAQGTVTFGGDGTIRLGQAVDVSLLGYATRVREDRAPWQSQVDVMVSRQLLNGSRVSLRARLIGGGTLPAAQQSVAFIEYGMPLRLPVSRLRTPGRVYGRVLDAVSGRGVPGALVRLGPQVAITDSRGDVAFGGVPGGEHRLSMSQETSFADAVFVGDPTVRVDSTRPRPTTFTLAIARSARLDIDVRRFVSARTAVSGAVDSLVDAGGLANATLVLVGDRDTLYRTTRADGKASFTDIPPGRWVVSVRGDAPAFHRFEPDRVELVLAPGESRTLAFRLVPRKREIQIIGGEQELRSQPAETRTPSPAAPAARTRKPDEHRPDA